MDLSVTGVDNLFVCVCCRKRRCHEGDTREGDPDRRRRALERDDHFSSRLWVDVVSHSKVFSIGSVERAISQHPVSVRVYLTDLRGTLNGLPAAKKQGKCIEFDGGSLRCVVAVVDCDFSGCSREQLSFHDSAFVHVS